MCYCVTERGGVALQRKGARTSFARLGWFPPNWAPFGHVRPDKNALDGSFKFGLVFDATFGFLFLTINSILYYIVMKTNYKINYIM